MPGSFFKLTCSGCGRIHEISTGTSYCIEHEHRPWSYEQVACEACKRLSSQAVGCHFEVQPCEHCGGRVAPWSGRVFFERYGEEPWQCRERITGPCPGCGSTLSESDAPMRGLWD